MAAGARGARAARTAARRQLAQALYQWQLSGQPWQDIYQQFSVEEDFQRCDTEYFRKALMEIAASRDALDVELALHAQIPPAQLDPVEHGILWLGLWELTTRPDVPYRVVINEGVELTRRFGATDGHKFVNAVLDKIASVHRGPERGAAA